MGTELGDLFKKQEINFKDLYGEKIAIDAYNTLYQFLSIIRQRDGTPLKDSKDRTTSHLSGLFYRTINLFEKGIKPIYVFDGKPPELKKKTIEERKETREKAEEEWKKAKEKGKKQEAFKKAIRSSTLTQEMIKNSKKLLKEMGVPSVQAPSEGEAQAAYMVKNNDCYGVGSQDYDSFLFGASKLVKNLTITGKRKLPGKDKYVEINLETYDLKENLKRLEITQEQLIDMAILVGTDYNEGIKGIGPKTAFEKIKKHGDIKAILDEINAEIRNLEKIKSIYEEPEVTDDYEISWGDPKEKEIIGYLCDKRDFSKNRVNKGINRLSKALGEIKNQSTLDSF